MYDIVIKQITEFDIPDKVKWYNDDEITEFLHYEEKFTIEKSLEWIKKIENDTSRYENVLKVKEDSQLVNIGIIGLFNIDLKNKKAGFISRLGVKNIRAKD